MTTKILILGHKGMLGNAVHKYFTSESDHEIITTEKRWGDTTFKSELENTDASVIINCIGAIPQKKPSDEQYIDINVNLPIFLESLGKRIIHPTTDCEFSGDLDQSEAYTKLHQRDAKDAYGKSKAKISELIENSFKNTKMIRVSIIGHELSSNYSLLDWFLNSDGTVNGYDDHYWNGVTTLAWAKICSSIMNNWDTVPTLNQYATDKNLTKYELLELIKKVYNKDIDINPVITGKVVNKCLTPDAESGSLENQLRELRMFYNR